MRVLHWTATFRAYRRQPIRALGGLDSAPKTTALPGPSGIRIRCLAHRCEWAVPPSPLVMDRPVSCVTSFQQQWAVLALALGTYLLSEAAH